MLFTGVGPAAPTYHTSPYHLLNNRSTDITHTGVGPQSHDITFSGAGIPRYDIMYNGVPSGSPAYSYERNAKGSAADVTYTGVGPSTTIQILRTRASQFYRDITTTGA